MVSLTHHQPHSYLTPSTRNNLPLIQADTGRQGKNQKDQFLSTFVRSLQFSLEKVRFDNVTSIYLFSQQLTLPLLFSPWSLDCLWPSLNVIGFYFLYTSARWPFCGFGMGVNANCYKSLIYYYMKLIEGKGCFVRGITIYSGLQSSQLLMPMYF